MWRGSQCGRSTARRCSRRRGDADAGRAEGGDRSPEVPHRVSVRDRSAAPADVRGRGTVSPRSRRLSMSSEHRGLGVLLVRAGQGAVLAVVEHGVCAVPVLHDLQAAVDLAAQVGAGEVVAGEDRAQRAAELFEGGVGGVLGSAARAGADRGRYPVWVVGWSAGDGLQCEAADRYEGGQGKVDPVPQGCLHNSLTSGFDVSSIRVAQPKHSGKHTRWAADGGDAYASGPSTSTTPMPMRKRAITSDSRATSSVRARL